MKVFLCHILWILLAIGTINSCTKNEKSEYKVTYAASIIPKPQKLEIKEGSFKIVKELQIVTDWDDDNLKTTIKHFSDILKKVNNVDIQLLNEQSSEKIPTININQNSDIHFGDEAYNLTISPQNISIEAHKPNGVFYAFQSILQLLPPQIFSRSKVENIDLTMPCVEISDKPRFKWRGLLFDVSRYFFPKEYIFKQLDYLAMHKMNIYHFHLTDDQGWRIENKKYPKLTDIGAWRKDALAYKPWMDTLKRLKKANNEANYGGYYTQDDIREIVKYAADRFITIVPEIEMPGHCISTLATYPQLSCTGQNYEVPSRGIGHANRKAYCAGNEKVFSFLEDVLTEVMELFPSEYIHIGGDEVNFSSWEKCIKCQSRIKKEHLKDEKELQSYFIKRVAKFINSKNKKLIGWDEIMAGGLPPKAVIMAWRENNWGILAARKSHDVIYTPDSHFYLNEYQGDPEFEPLAYNHFTPLRKVYSFDPIFEDSLTIEQEKHIIGVEAALWSNFNSTISNSNYLLFPRLAAVSEVAWSNKNLRNWNDFALRMEKQLERYDYANIGYAKTLYDVTAKFEVDRDHYNLIVTLQNEAGNTQIRYTEDGSEPTINSTLYEKPFSVNKVSKIKAISFRDNSVISRRTTEIDIFASKATGLPVKVEFPYDKRYTASGELGLTDGITGLVTYSGEEWQGYLGIDFIGVIDLLKERDVKKISAHFLHANDAGIFFPKYIEVFISNDNKNYKSISIVKNDIPVSEKEKITKTFMAIFDKTKARYIKIIAKNIGKCPKGHKYAGADAFIFIDEICVE